MPYSEPDSGGAGKILLTPGTFVSSYTTAEMTLLRAKRRGIQRAMVQKMVH